jgi:tetratricopeptide (TPR) repeat protein
MRRKRVNFTRALILICTLASLGTGLHFVNAFQVKRNAHGLLARAHSLERAGEPERATRLLRQYLKFKPEDADAWVEYGRLVLPMAKDRRGARVAYLAMYQALYHDPSRHDLRPEIARLALKAGRFADAKSVLEPLEQDDVETLRLRAECEVGLRDFKKAANYYEGAVRLTPKDIPLCEQYAQLLRDYQQYAEADKKIEHLVEANAGSAPARTAAVKYFLKARNPEKADEYIESALKEKKTDAELLLLASERALARGNKEGDEKGRRAAVEQARGYLQTGQREHPGEMRFSLSLARLELDHGRREEAMKIVQRCLKSLPQQPDQLSRLTNLLIDAGAADEVQTLIKTLEKQGHGSTADYFKARQHVQKGEWTQGRKLLQQLRSRPFVSEQALAQIDFLLAECELKLLHTEQARLGYESALKRDPGLSLLAGQRLAATLIALNQGDKALALYRKLGKNAPELRLELAYLLLTRNVRLPAADKNWDEVKGILKDLPARLQQSWEAQVLGANLLLAQNKGDEARRLVEAVRDGDPKKPGPWLFLAALEERDGRPQAVLSMLDQAEKNAGRKVEFELARMRYWMRKDRGEAQKPLAALETRLGEYAVADQERLLAGLAQAYLVAGHAEHGIQLLRQLSKRQPGNLNVRFQLFELSLQNPKTGEADKQLAEIRRLDGNGAKTSYGEAALAFLRARDGDPQANLEVRDSLERAASFNPTWPRIAALWGDLLLLENRKEQALEKYQAAIAQGENRIAVYRRVLQLLFEQTRYAEANVLLGKMPDASLLSTDLAPLAAQSLLVPDASKDAAAARERALGLARKMGENAKDYKAHLWHGQVAWMAERHDEAEKALRKAVEMNDSTADTWAALILFLARPGGDAKKAELEMARASEKLPRNQVSLAFAPALEATGKLRQAEAQYKAALAAQPDNPTVVKNAAGFYLRHGRQSEAEPYLRQLLKSDTKTPPQLVAWARQRLALALAFLGNHKNYQEALRLVEENLKDRGDTEESRRISFLVMASHPTDPSRRREAIRLFESLSTKESRPGADMQFMLIRLYEADGDWSAAQSNLRILLAAHEKNSVYLAYYVRALLRHGLLDQAQSWLDKLVQVRPKAFETIELQARVLAARKKESEAAALLASYSKEKDAPLGLIALLLDDIGQHAAAGKMFRTLAATSKVPESVLPLARHLAQQKQTSAALEICAAAWKTCKSEAVASTCVTVLRLGGGSAAQQKKVEAWIKKAIADDSKAVRLPLVLAGLQEMQGRLEEPIALYRKALAQNEDNIIALNNLAYLLALKDGNSREALDRIQHAIKLAGPVPDLLDTRALIHLRGHRVSQAMQDLQQAIAEKPSPTKYLHLAEAEWMVGNRKAAREALAKISNLERELEQIHFLERPSVKKLAADLN